MITDERKAELRKAWEAWLFGHEVKFDGPEEDAYLSEYGNWRMKNGPAAEDRHGPTELPYWNTNQEKFSDDITYLRGRADGARREGRHDHAAKLDGIADRLAKIEESV